MILLAEIIIPVLNEEKILKEKRDYYLWLKEQCQIIFVDGGSYDRTVNLAQEFGKVISSDPGRYIQMNRGALEGQRKYFLFLHVDTFLTSKGLQRINEAITQGVNGGCLTLAIADSKFIFRIFEWLVNIRARYFRVFDGDLGLLVRKDIFQELGGFDEVKIMEDILFSKKIKKRYEMIVLPEKIHVSSRVWYEKGFLKTFLWYSRVYIKFWQSEFFVRDYIIKEPV